ncbi:MAG: dockerin type I repeat-containing protein [Ruminococcus sp.]|nr:dockerin type I repeat-containing protein [Ruminococcus sp.]
MRKRFCSLLCALTLMFTLFAYLPQGVIRAGAANKISGSFYMGYYDWDEVSGAKDYFVTFESKKQSGSFTTTKSEFKIADHFTYKGYLYSFKIYARNSSGKTIAESYLDYWSDTAEITGVKLSADLTKLEWDAFEGDFEEYSINIFYPGGAGGFDVEKGVTSANLLEKMADSDRPTGTYRVNVAATLREGYTRRMGWSEEIPFEYESQNKYVSKTSVTVDIPYAGQTPADITDAKIVINDGSEGSSEYVRMYTLLWGEKDPDSSGYFQMFDNDVFKKDTEYRLQVMIYLKDGCYMDRGVAYDNGDYSSSVNGTDARMINMSALKQYYLEYKFTPKSPIDRVDLNLTEPVAGQAPNNTATVTKGEAKVTLVQWTENNVLADTFEAGKTYNARLVLSPLTGYTFTEDTKVYFNGKQAEVWALMPIFGGYKGNVAYTLDFDCKGASGRKKGDYNGDGVIGIDDLSVLKKAMINLVKLTGDDFNVMDVNSDGVLDLKDLTAMKRHMLNVKKLW